MKSLLTHFYVGILVSGLGVLGVVFMSCTTPTVLLPSVEPQVNEEIAARPDTIPAEMDSIRSAISYVRYRMAPDSRTSIFSITPTWKDGTYSLEGESNMPEVVDTLYNRLAKGGIRPTNRIAMLPDSTLKGYEQGVINVSVAAIRTQPKHSAELATQALLGTFVRIYKKQEGWWLIQTPDNYLGWIEELALVPMQEKQSQVWRGQAKGIFLNDFGLILTAPREDAPRLMDIPLGGIVLMKDVPDDWTQVALADGRTGFLPSRHLKPLAAWSKAVVPDFLQSNAYTTEQGADNPTPEHAILQTARQLMGRPYLWGGTSPYGMDCSGFTKMVFYLNGMVIERDASQQVRLGVPVSTDTTLVNLQAGDLLFFGQKYAPGQSEKITHVGIYLGDGRMIHASGEVKIQSLRRGDPDFAPERLATLVRARRWTQSVGLRGIWPVKYMDWIGTK